MNDSTGVGQVDELTTLLSTYLAQQAGHPVAVTTLTRISDGWESDVYAFNAPEWREGEYILRLYFGANAGPTALHEFRSMDLLMRAGYPVPKVNLVETSARLLGRSFLIMDRISQGVPLGKFWRDPTPGVRKAAIERFCQLFIQLHTLEWAHLPGAQHVPSLTIEQQFELWRGYLQKYPIDAMQRAIEWLDAACTQVTRQPLGLVHWDFHHENILVDRVNHAWVIDWTQFQATDIRFDLAWTLVLLASERDVETAQEVRAGYLALHGWDKAVIQPDLDFFEAAACIKRLASVMISFGAGADAVGMRPGAETLMSSRMPRFAVVYKRWFALTGLALPDVETMLTGHL